MARSRKPKFPYRDSDSKALEKGEQIARARYYSDIKSTAEEIAKEYRAGDIDDIEQRIHEEAERAVIYTKDQFGILMESDSWQAIDDLGEIPQGAAAAVAAMAFWAYRQDLSEAVEEFGVDRNPGKPRKDSRVKVHSSHADYDAGLRAGRQAKKKKIDQAIYLDWSPSKEAWLVWSPASSGASAREVFGDRFMETLISDKKTKR